MAKKKSSQTVSKRRSTNVPDTYRGFSVQATRFLYHLLSSGMDDFVSLEYFEDVGVETPDGGRVAEQDKSYRASNPLADRSVVFWKTLRNWCDAAKDGTLPASRTAFIAYAPNATMGNVVQAFHDSKSLEDAKSAIERARGILRKGDAWDISDAAKEHVEIVFAASNIDTVASILVNFSVDATKEGPEEALRPVLLEKFVGPDSFDLVIRQAHGWVKQQIDRFVDLGKPVRILKRDFHEPLLSFIRTHDRINILQSVAGVPTADEVAAELTVRDYVRQLRIIDLEEIAVLEAVNDYLRASVDRTVWSENGLINEESLALLEVELTRTWRNKNRTTRLVHSEKDSKIQGQLTYSDCLEHDAKVDNLMAPRLFIRGSWHALADDLTIGWHPNYPAELAAPSCIAAKKDA